MRPETIIPASIDIGSNGGRKEGTDYENGKGNIRDGREVGQCLMKKVITAKKLQLNQQANKRVGQIYTLEKIVLLSLSDAAGSIDG